MNGRREFIKNSLLSVLTFTVGLYTHSSSSNQSNVIESNWQNILLDIAQKNNIPGSIRKGSSIGLSIGLSHSKPKDKAQNNNRVLNSFIDEIRFRKLLPFFEEIGNHYKLVFVAEGFDAQGYILDKNKAKKYDILLPESLHSLKVNWQFTGADTRPQTYGADGIKIIKEYRKIFEKIQIQLSVPEGESYDIIDEISAPFGAKNKGELTDADYARIFIFGKLHHKMDKIFENNMKELGRQLIQKGYFPVFLMGANHAPMIDTSYVFANASNMEQVVYSIKEDIYIDHILGKNPGYSPNQIPEEFKKYMKYLQSK
ncbi:hypothetical protein MK079_04975 [Candidatus Gracilibacteria bacterium]|nr:hypothetical protein [Candidatus Gracilibacteria bacterium]